MKAESARAHTQRFTRTHGRESLPPSSPQGTSVFKQQNKRAGPLASHRKQARSVQVSAKLLEIWGAGGPPPLKLNLYLLTIIATRPASESEGVAPRNLTAGLFRQYGRIDDDTTRALKQGGRLPRERPSGLPRSPVHVRFRSHLQSRLPSACRPANQPTIVYTTDYFILSSTFLKIIS
jgi:hypothetical protein